MMKFDYLLQWYILLINTIIVCMHTSDFKVFSIFLQFIQTDLYAKNCGC